MGTPPIFPCGNTGGEGDALIRSLCCGYSFQPLRLADTSPIFCVVKHPVMLQDTVGEKLKDNLYWQNRFFCLYASSEIEEI